MLPSENGDNRKIPPTPPRGLRRMEGMAQLTPSKCLNFTQENVPESLGRARSLSRTKTVIGPIFPDFSKSETTPPTGLRRCSSGSMLLRQTPERLRRQEQDEEESGSPKKRFRRSGSLPKLALPELAELQSTPTLKRKRTSSLTSLSSKLRPRALSETLALQDLAPPPSALEISPIKKRHRQGSPSSSRQSSPLKKSTKFVSNHQEIGSQTPLRRQKLAINTRILLSERISLNYASVAKLPAIVTRTTSGEEYFSASEGPERYQDGYQDRYQDEQQEKEQKQEKEEVFVTPQTSFQTVEGEMVPLVKKQISIDEKTTKNEDDEEDEGFGDSTKTIKKGQGAALARSLSLKLSPRLDMQKPIGLGDTELQKSCSTPSLPTAPLLRRASTSSLRFKVSPSTFLRPPPPPLPAELPVELPVVPVEPSVPSTSTSSMPVVTVVDESVQTPPKKSALRKERAEFVVREEQFGIGIGPRRRRRVKYEGLKVYYFDRRQGESTVPSEGEISLDMHNTHHTHRYFPLSTAKRPVLDLQLYEDEELSDGEVIHSDEERDYEEFASAKFIASINQKFRIKLLKKSGVKVEKSESIAIDSIRKMRVECGCSCENGVCLPETCQCALDGIQCQVDGGEYPTVPCACFAETCTNPNGRIFYDPDAVRHHRTQSIMNWNAAQKSSIGGSPVRRKFVDSDEEEEESTDKKSWLLKKAIPILKKLEPSPTKFPVTPVYTRRSRSNLSDIRESTGECSGIPVSTSTSSLSDRMKAMQHLENEVCHEVDEKEETMREQEEEAPDMTLRGSESIEEEPELLEAPPTLSPVTLVV